MKKFLLLPFLSIAIMAMLVSKVSAASADGSGPWADSVVSSSQGNMKNGQPVPAIRSNPQAAVGVAENDTQDDHFFSLGFGGNIVLHFDNGVRDGVIVVEATNVGYPVEKAHIDVSANGSSWTSAGNVNQDGQVSMPENLSCVNYVRITDTSNTADFTDDTADAYDVDGVQAINGQSCDGGNTGEETPTPTPTPDPGNPTVTPTSAPTPTSVPNDSHDGGNNNPGGSTPYVCTATKPGTPALQSINRTSGSTVKLTWSAVSPVTTYSISYGTSPGNYQYGVPSTGNVTEFTIGGLDPNAKYYFAVRAVNDCMPGDPSGENTPSGQVLGATTGDVLGATTDTLAATGSFEQSIHILFSVLAATGTFALLGIAFHMRKQK